MERMLGWLEKVEARWRLSGGYTEISNSSPFKLTKHDLII